MARRKPFCVKRQGASSASKCYSSVKAAKARARKLTKKHGRSWCVFDGRTGKRVTCIAKPRRFKKKRK